MKQGRKKHAPKTSYTSPNQLKLEEFETPFEQVLNSTNRWIVLSRLIPWNEICGVYLKHVGKASTGRPPLNPRVVIGALIIKHLCNFDDNETVEQISENMYMQYFLGYSGFLAEVPFDSSLFVEIRKRLGMDCVNAINEQILSLKNGMGSKKLACENKDAHNFQSPTKRGHKSKNRHPINQEIEEKTDKDISHKGRVLLDATACPQDIAYPTDLDLLSKACKISEGLIDILYQKKRHKKSLVPTERLQERNI